MTDGTPFGDLTPRQEEVIDFGWEMCKIHKAPGLVIWFAEEGWHECWQISAEKRTDGIAVKAKLFDEGIIFPPSPINYN